MSMAEPKKNEFNALHNEIASLGKALAHPARVMILEILVNNNNCVNDLVERLPLSQSTVSQHIKELKASGIIKAKVIGNKYYYCVQQDKLSKVVQKAIKLLRVT
jgi:ArsR family transcriptional regulator